MQKLADVKGEIIHSGVHPGIPNQQVPLWEESNNVIFPNLAVKVAPGQVPLFEKASSKPGTGILAVNNGGSPGLIWGTRDRLYRGITQPTTENVTRYTASPGDDDYTPADDSDLWSIVQFGTKIIATNGVDAVQYLADFAVTANFVDFDTVSDLPGSFRCNSLYSTGAFLLAYNTDNVNYEYRWCAEDDVLVWTPNAFNKARDFQVRDLGSEIMAVTSIGDQIVFFGRGRAHYSGFVGPPYFFPNDHLLSGVGAVGKHSVTPVGRRIFGFSSNGMYVIDGASFEYIDTPSIRSYVYEDTYDDTQGSKVTVWADTNENIVFFSYPTRGGGGFTVGFNHKTGAWSMFDWYRTAASTGGLWRHPVLVDQNGQTWVQNPTATPVSGFGKPVLLYDTMVLQMGYGHPGFGEGGYGGEWPGVDV